MKRPFAKFVVFALAILPHCTLGAEEEDGANPIAKIITLLTDLQGKVIAIGEGEKKNYNAYVEWCDATARETQFSIKDGQAKQETLEAAIEKSSSDANENTVQIQELSGSISTDEADLKAATLLREKERSDFEATDKELVEAVETLARARRVLEKELDKAGIASASFLSKPTQGMKLFTAALKELANSAEVIISLDDRSKLDALLQEVQGGDSSGEDSDEQPSGAPEAAVYKSHSGGIQEALKGLQDKLVASRAEYRKKEQTAQYNFDLFKQSMLDKIASQKKDLDETKTELAQAEEVKANAEGELETCKKDLAADQEDLAKLQHDCMERASAFEAEVRSRSEELKALASAKKAIQDMTGGAQEQAYSFIQTQSGHHMRIRDGPATLALQRLKQLASQTRSMALAQVTTKLAAAIRARSRSKGGSDPFAKVKSLIVDLIGKLEKEHAQEAEQKVFCDREMSHTLASKKEKEEEVEILSSKMEMARSEVAQLKEEVATVQRELLELTKSQKESDTIRMDEHSTYVKVKEDYEEGLKGIQVALKVLRDYYAEDSEGEAASLVQTGEDGEDDMSSSMRSAGSQPAGESGGKVIIGMLQVVESDLAKNLAELQEEEEAAQDEYDKLTQEGKVVKARKVADVKHKTANLLSLQKSIAEYEADRSTVQQELDAVNEYYQELKPQCVAKPETYEERKARRQAEIEGLREALEILESEGTG
jgi:hypothetical protein